MFSVCAELCPLRGYKRAMVRLKSLLMQSFGVANQLARLLPTRSRLLTSARPHEAVIVVEFDFGWSYPPGVL